MSAGGCVYSRDIARCFLDIRVSTSPALEVLGLSQFSQFLVGHQVPVMPSKVGHDKLGIRAGHILGSLQAVSSRVLSMGVLCTTLHRHEATGHNSVVTLLSSSFVL